MTRRIIKQGCLVEACREARPTVTRRFEAGAVLNILQWVNPATGRFTAEGEGADVWCCSQAVMDDQTESPAPSQGTQPRPSWWRSTLQLAQRRTVDCYRVAVVPQTTLPFEGFDGVSGFLHRAVKLDAEETSPLCKL